jgi:hypothetical protein
MRVSFKHSVSLRTFSLNLKTKFNANSLFRVFCRFNGFRLLHHVIGQTQLNVKNATVSYSDTYNTDFLQINSAIFRGTKFPYILLELHAPSKENSACT